MSLFSSGVTQFKKEFSRIETSEPKLRSFAFLVGGILVTLGLFAFYRDHALRGEWLSGVGLMLVAIGVVRPTALAPLYRLWMGLAIVLGVVVGNTLLILFFFLVLTPIGVLKRFFLPASKDTSGSYWLPTATFQKESLERPF